MSDFNYIKVSLYGQFQGELRTEMKFPSASAADPSSKLTVFNPTKVLDQFVNARECYALWQTVNGSYYGLVTRNPLDPTSGAMLLTIKVPHGIILSGRHIMQAFSNLRKVIVDDHQYTDEAVVDALRAADLPKNPTVIEGLARREEELLGDPENQPKATGYRTYMSGHELDTILSFPYQDDSRKYRRVLIVSATASLQPGARIARITSSVKRRFWVLCPAGVTASPEEVIEGERLTLTFTKAGFNTTTESVVAGATSPYLKYDGAVIKVKSPSESGLAFKRRVRLDVKSAKGGAVHGYTITVNGRPINTMEPFVELTEKDLTSGKKIQINIASNNFQPMKIEKDPAELASKDTLDIVLDPLEQGILLRLDFGEGRMFEQHISLERNTPEYSQLHSGNFHGFRAYRISTQGSNETYNVDVRSASKPTAPTFANATQAAQPAAQAQPQQPTPHQAPSFGNTAHSNLDVARPKRVIPVFENISGDNASSRQKPEAKKAPDTKAPEKPSEPQKSSFGFDDEEPRHNNKTGIIIGVVGVVALIILALVFFLPHSTEDEVIEAENITVSGTVIDENTAGAVAAASPAQPVAGQEGQTQQPAATASPAAPAADEAADIAYLNGNTSWKLADLKTEKYKALVRAIQAGDVQAMANNDYFAVKGQATNSKAIAVMDYAWGAVGTDAEKKQKDYMIEQSKAEGVNIFDLWDGLSRRMPKDKNNAPRPTR